MYRRAQTPSGLRRRPGGRQGVLPHCLHARRETSIHSFTYVRWQKKREQSGRRRRAGASRAKQSRTRGGIVLLDPPTGVFVSSPILRILLYCSHRHNGHDVTPPSSIRLRKSRRDRGGGNRRVVRLLSIGLQPSGHPCDVTININSDGYRARYRVV